MYRQSWPQLAVATDFSVPHKIKPENILFFLAASHILLRCLYYCGAMVTYEDLPNAIRAYIMEMWRERKQAAILIVINSTKIYTWYGPPASVQDHSIPTTQGIAI